MPEVPKSLFRSHFRTYFCKATSEKKHFQCSVSILCLQGFEGIFGCVFLISTERAKSLQMGPQNTFKQHQQPRGANRSYSFANCGSMSNFSIFRPECVANPPAPYSIQKCPEPQICQKFVPAIVFQGSTQGDPNLSKICRKFEKLSGNCRFSNFRQIWVPLIGTPKNNRRHKFLTNFLVNLFLIKFVMISGFSSLFSAIAVFLVLSGKMC